MTVDTSLPTATQEAISMIPYEIRPNFPVSEHFERLAEIEDIEAGKSATYIFECFADSYAHLNILDEMGYTNTQIFQKYRKQVKCIGLEIEYAFRSEYEASTLEEPLILASKSARLPVLCKPDFSLGSSSGIEINTAPGTIEQIVLFLNTLLDLWTVPEYSVHSQTGLHLNIDTSWFSSSRNALLMNWLANNKTINTHLEEYYGRRFQAYDSARTRNYGQLLTLSSIQEVIDHYSDPIYYSTFRYKGDRWEWRSFKAVKSIDDVEKILKAFYMFLDLAHQQELFVEDREQTEQNIINHLALCKLQKTVCEKYKGLV